MAPLVSFQMEICRQRWQKSIIKKVCWVKKRRGGVYMRHFPNKSLTRTVHFRSGISLCHTLNTLYNLKVLALEFFIISFITLKPTKLHISPRAVCLPSRKFPYSISRQVAQISIFNFLNLLVNDSKLFENKSIISLDNRTSIFYL